MNTKTNIIIQKITQEIEDGTWPGGSQLPSETELSNIFQVSRATIRQALQEMAFSGKVIRKRGIGTFVGNATIQYGINDLVSITNLISQSGYKVSVEHVSLKIEKPSAKVCELLNMSEFDPVYSVERIILADNIPVVFERIIYPAHILTGVKEEAFYGSNFKMLEQRGIYIQSSEGKISPVYASKHMASLLKLPTNAPLLFMDSVFKNQNQEAIYCVEEYFTEMFSFPIHRVRLN
ncbi:GntR family transcriptional regulator [Paenibacillus gorillae]|uniref:GntR family transcriptional regulator n=1 Tax=Paenibacillus gorillae TaxID=1243662 RepID=UPI0005A7D917|nr:GntR family transcriptional regulator [Paenibacillus gorillae]